MTDNSSPALAEKQAYYDLIHVSRHQAEEIFVRWFLQSGGGTGLSDPNAARQQGVTDFSQRLKFVLEAHKQAVALDHTGDIDAYMNRFVAWHAIRDERPDDWSNIVHLDFPVSPDETPWIKSINRHLADIGVGDNAFFRELTNFERLAMVTDIRRRARRDATARATGGKSKPPKTATVSANLGGGSVIPFRKSAPKRPARPRGKDPKGTHHD